MGHSIGHELAVSGDVRVMLEGQAAAVKDKTPRIELSGTETILLVDDEASARNLIERQLQGLGYRVITAGSAEEALEQCRSAGFVDLLVTDIAMPGRDGLSLARELCGTNPALKVLFISGFNQPGRGSTLLEPERNLLTKPFRARSLAEKVRELLDGQPRTR